MSAIEHFSIYFKSANDVPVERAVIPATVAEGVIADFEQLRLISKEQNDALRNFVNHNFTYIDDYVYVMDGKITLMDVDNGRAALKKYESINEK